jgi:hypothetical protein
MNWTVEGRGDEFAIVDEMGVEVASVPYTDETGAEPLNTAEGRRAVLLASAPDLLAALENAVRCGERDGMPGSPGSAPAWVTQARAAIQRARGISEEDEMEQARR